MAGPSQSKGLTGYWPGLYNQAWGNRSKGYKLAVGATATLVTGGNVVFLGLALKGIGVLGSLSALEVASISMFAEVAIPTVTSAVVGSIEQKVGAERQMTADELDEYKPLGMSLGGGQD